MTRAARALLILAALVAAGSGGYWLASQPVKLDASSARGVSQTMPAPSGAVIYYQDPDGKPFYATEQKTTPDGRPWKAVKASEDLSFTAEPVVATAPAGKKILYYRNPMGLPDVSQTPKKDSMGMDYIAVYEGEDQDGTTVTLSPGKIQRIGVASEAAGPRVLQELVRAPGTIQLDERRIAVISMRAEAFIDTVDNVTTGSPVRKGQPLMRLYSPAISSAAADYLSVLGAKGDSEERLRGARQRLLNLAVPELLGEIERRRQVPLVFTWTAPRDGIVLDRNVSDGMRVMPGDVLFRIGDPASVWAMLDVAEAQLADVAQGQKVMVRVRSYPEQKFPGTVALIYPQLNPSTRTVRVRVELANPDFKLRPDMYAEGEFETGSARKVIAVPDSALIDSGDRQVVIVDKGDGRFEPRPVKPGRRGVGYVEIRDGVADGEKVVTSANFLIDAESNLKAALKGLGGGAQP